MADDFLKVVFEWKEKSVVKMMTAVREAIMQMNNEIVITTPVDTGFLRNSWYASLNVVPQGQSGSGASAINAVALSMQPGDTYYLGNVAVYARRVEYGFVGQDSLGRTYNQQGRFWVARVVDRASEFFDAAALKVSAT